MLHTIYYLKGEILNLERGQYYYTAELTQGQYKLLKLTFAGAMVVVTDTFMYVANTGKYMDQFTPCMPYIQLQALDQIFANFGLTLDISALVDAQQSTKFINMLNTKKSLLK